MSVASGSLGPVGRAVWFIETHFAQELRLDDVAAASGVSRYHLSRVFSLVTGCGLARYIRDRRLSEAARVLAEGAPNILAVALDAGYGSHEAFTRAFRDRFGLTPEAMRGRQLNTLMLTEALRMDSTSTIDLQPPRIDYVERLKLAGLPARYENNAIAGIPAQWQRFVPMLEGVAARVGDTTYGVMRNSDAAGSFQYICAVEVRTFDALPTDWTHCQITGQRYAVFTHHAHIAALKNTMVAIWNRWLPSSGYEPADAPEFERYDERFDPQTGLGGLEIWIPIKGQE